MNENYKLELIEKYLEGRLEGKELSQLENDLASDPQLAREVAWQKEAMEALGDKGMRTFQAELHAFQEQSEEKKTTEKTPAKVVKMKPFRRVLSMAASLLVLAAAAFWLLREPALTHDIIADRNLVLPSEEEMTEGVLKGKTNNEEKTDAEKTTEAAMEAYGKKEYGKAVRLLASISEKSLTKDERPSYLYQKGIFYLANGDYDKAYQVFGNENAAGKYDREWFRALILLKQKASKEDLVKAFSAIASSRTNVTYRDKAKEVLGLLEKLE